MERLGDRIKKARLAAGMTQQAAADKIGIHVTRLSQWERGVEPRSGMLLKIALLLGVTVDSLIPQEED